MIRILEDVGAPVAVTAVDLLTTEMAPDWNEWSSYILTGVGYAAGFFMPGKYSAFLTNLGVASLPLTARHIYNRVKGTTSRVPTASRMALRPVSRSAAPAGPVNRQYEKEFTGAHAY